MTSQVQQIRQITHTWFSETLGHWVTRNEFCFGIKDNLERVCGITFYFFERIENDVKIYWMEQHYTRNNRPHWKVTKQKFATPEQRNASMNIFVAHGYKESQKKFNKN